ncbi:MAG: 4Fe-4S dicluster domain-containing protein [Spirochaetia bacterium]|nr:4Fe-4S dicluster domain-containing protein [Spirochaetia bacterium]
MLSNQKPKSAGECKTAGRVQPIVNLSKCAGKRDCFEVCPYGVFEMREMNQEERSNLDWVGKIKTIVHGSERAFVVNSDQCHACGLCVVACPEKAVKLIPVLMM